VLIDDNTGHVNVVVREADYKALKRGIEYLPPPMQWLVATASSPWHWSRTC
jgi:hypothetical protein